MKFIVLCYPRTGSTLLITALGAHPAVRQGMEIFNPVLEGDAPWVDWRKETFASLYGPQDSYLNPQGYLDGERFNLRLLSERFFADFDGTKIMYDQLARNSGVWDHVRSLPDLRVIVLRRNIVEAAVSFRIAMETGLWHVAAGGDVPATPRLTYEPGYIGWFYDHFCAPEPAVLDLFGKHRLIEVDYDDLVSAWPRTLRSVQAGLGLEPLAEPPPFRKGTQGSLEDLIVNYSEVRAHYDRHPILARHFETASRPAAAPLRARM
ncbi:Stf0 family sulfotransferase [Bosea sp. (in: a-proteobacteria)]|jgi:LPS sulfotransferase NodH|uniref:Stf0 family sulfotransferase n=1 Tax=Bosea sp. (in: a-proteobacteria) TaxID=1871050 RepID=UPI003F6F804C